MSSLIDFIPSITNLSNEPGELTFDDIKSKFSEKDSKFSLKEDDNVFMLYCDDGEDVDIRNCVVKKDGLKPLTFQYKIFYNKDGLKHLEECDWSNVTVQKCYEGTVLQVFNHEGMWYVSTRRCLNAGESSWVKNTSYREMFDESIKDRFTLEDLNPDYCYSFILLHHKNRNIVNYDEELGRDYKTVVHLSTTKKYSSEEVDVEIPNVYKPESVSFESLEELQESLVEISALNEKTKKVTLEGYVLRVGNITVKLQTELYQHLSKVKPNNSNIHQSYLELYQKDHLNDFLPYFTRFNNDIIKRINRAMKKLSREVLDIYHSTRKRNNEEVYNALEKQYRKALYDLHKGYIDNRKQDFENGDDKDEDGVPKKLSRSVTVHDVYHYLKDLQPNQLRQLFYERMKMEDNEVFGKFLNKDKDNSNIYIKTQGTLMFTK